MSKAYADATLVAYRFHAAEAVKNWNRFRKPSGFLKRFAARLCPGETVLDYGCGIGNELVWLRKKGFRAEGVDGTPDFVLEARRRNPGARIVQGRFDSIALAAGHFGGIWCNAALIHVPPSVLARQISKLKEALKTGGVLGMTLAWGRLKGLVEADWIPGRYIAGYTKPEAARFFHGWGLEHLAVVSGAGRQGRWIQILAKKGNKS